MPQFGSCESGESGGLSPVQFQSVSSQSSQDTKKEGQTEDASSVAAPASSTSATTSTLSGFVESDSLTQNRVDQSSLVGSSQQRLDEVAASGRSQGDDVSTEDREQSTGEIASLQAGGSEAEVAVKADNGGQAKDQEESIGQSSELTTRFSKTSESDSEGNVSEHLTESPSGNEAAAKE